MKNILLWMTLSLSTLALNSCLPEEEPTIDPCNDYEWARVDRDGNEMCFPAASVSMNEANTSNAYIQAQFYTPAEKSQPSISAFFKVPASGLELDTAYPAYDGDFFGSEDVVDGEIVFSSYSTQDSFGHFCFTGTFHLTTKNTNSGTTSAFTNGKFVWFQPGKNLESYNACNPF